MINNGGSNRAVSGTCAPVPNSFVFMQFSAEILQNNRLLHSRSWRPLGNPGFATDQGHNLKYNLGHSLEHNLGHCLEHNLGQYLGS